MELSGKIVLALSLKRTGTAVLRCVSQRGSRARETDRQTQAQLVTGLASPADIPFNLRLRTQDKLLLDGIDAVVSSSAVPRTASVCHSAHHGAVFRMCVEEI
ncbi:MAG: hypothetical protein EXR78_05275 [Deltaproteobacteria bacterium]|nr:hypothetical protein [Deltaproteobacteria bacterium]